MWLVTLNRVMDTETGRSYFGESNETALKLAGFLEDATSNLVRLYCVNKGCGSLGSWVDRSRTHVSDMDMCSCEACGSPMEAKPNCFSKAISAYHVITRPSRIGGEDVVVEVEITIGEESFIYRANNLESAGFLDKLVSDNSLEPVKVYCWNDRCKDRGTWVTRRISTLRKVGVTCATCEMPMTTTDAKTTEDKD